MHHNDAPGLDPRTDITDLYVFQKPGDPSKSILILNVNPEAPTRANAFDPRASYELKIDINGDFEAEIALLRVEQEPTGIEPLIPDRAADSKVSNFIPHRLTPARQRTGSGPEPPP